MSLKSITLILFAVALVSPKCDNELQCFKAKLFNFDSPTEGIYPIGNVTNQDKIGQTNVLGYGDFNNDLQYLCR